MRKLLSGVGLAVVAAGLTVPVVAQADPQLPCGVSSYPVGTSYVNVRYKNCTQKGVVVRPWHQVFGAQGDCRQVAANGDWATWVGLPYDAGHPAYEIVNCRD